MNTHLEHPTVVQFSSLCVRLEQSPIGSKSCVSLLLRPAGTTLCFLVRLAELIAQGKVFALDLECGNARVTEAVAWSLFRALISPLCCLTRFFFTGVLFTSGSAREVWNRAVGMNTTLISAEVPIDARAMQRNGTMQNIYMTDLWVCSGGMVQALCAHPALKSVMIKRMSSEMTFAHLEELMRSNISEIAVMSDRAVAHFDLDAVFECLRRAAPKSKVSLGGVFPELAVRRVMRRAYHECLQIAQLRIGGLMFDRTMPTTCVPQEYRYETSLFAMCKQTRRNSAAVHKLNKDMLGMVKEMLL